MRPLVVAAVVAVGCTRGSVEPATPAHGELRPIDVPAQVAWEPEDVLHFGIAARHPDLDGDERRWHERARYRIEHDDIENWQATVFDLERGYAVSGDPLVLAGLAQQYARYDVVRGLAAARLYLERSPDRTPELARAVQKTLDAAMAKVAWVTVRCLSSRDVIVELDVWTIECAGTKTWPIASFGVPHQLLVRLPDPPGTVCKGLRVDAPECKAALEAWKEERKQRVLARTSWPHKAGDRRAFAIDVP
jgi:hypothetical protein